MNYSEIFRLRKMLAKNAGSEKIPRDITGMSKAKLDRIDGSTELRMMTIAIIGAVGSRT